VSEADRMAWTVEIAFPAQAPWDEHFDAPLNEVSMQDLGFCWKGEIK
jgi:hypothetical protein